MYASALTDIALSIPKLPEPPKTAIFLIGFFRSFECFKNLDPNLF